MRYGYDYWQTIERAIFDDNSVKMAANEIEHLLKIAHFNKQDKILDVCCGIGRHTLEIAKRGYVIKGLDAHEPFINTAQNRAAKYKIDVDFILSDVFDYYPPEKYGVLLCLGNSFGFTEDKSEDFAFLQKVYDLLQSGGTFVFELVNKGGELFNFESTRKTTLGNSLIMETREFNETSHILKSVWTITDSHNNENKRIDMAQRLYSKEMIEDVLASLNFCNMTVLGDYDGRVYNETSKRMVIIANS